MLGQGDQGQYVWTLLRNETTDCITAPLTHCVSSSVLFSRMSTMASRTALSCLLGDHREVAASKAVSCPRNRNSRSMRDTDGTSYSLLNETKRLECRHLKVNQESHSRQRAKHCSHGYKKHGVWNPLGKAEHFFVKIRNWLRNPWRFHLFETTKCN